MRPVESASFYPWHLDAGGDHGFMRWRLCPVLEHGGICVHFNDGYTPDFPLFFSFYVIMTKRASDMNGYETVRFMRCR